MSGDEEFISLVTESQGWLYGHILAALANRDAANEVLQETNLVIWRKASEFEIGTNFHAWAMRIANFQVMAFRQKRMRDHIVFDQDLIEVICSRSQQRVPSYEEKMKLLARCLDRLSEHSRELVLRRYLRGESLKAIAEDLNKKQNAIGQLMFRIKGKLVRCVSHQPVGEHHAG